VSVAAPEPEETIKVERVSSPKFTQDLLDTPQTIAVVSKEVLKQQGATTLSQALKNTPASRSCWAKTATPPTGDSIFMRGFDTQGSIFVDGIRDLAPCRATRSTPNRSRSPRVPQARTMAAARRRAT
jgi:catecholate siderophore receptor